MGTCQLRQIRVKKDGACAWFICFFALINNAIINGINQSFGVILGSLIESFGSSATTVSWIPAIHTSVWFLFAWISTMLTQKYGFRVVIIAGAIISCISHLAAACTNNFVFVLLTYGVIGGVGSGLRDSIGNIVCSYYFEKYREIATGIAMCGGGVGIALVGPLANFVNTQYGEQGVFVAFSLLSLLSIFLGVTVFPTECNKEDLESRATDQNIEEADYEKRDCEIDPKTPTQGSKQPLVQEAGKIKTFFAKFALLKDMRILFYCLGKFLFEMAFYIPPDYLPEMMVKDHGFPQSVEGTIMAILGASIVVGRILSGLIAKIFKKYSIIMSALSLTVIGSGLVGLAFCSTFEEFFGVTVLYGLCAGSYFYLGVIILIEMYGVSDKFQDAYGLVMLASMFSPILGPPIGGFMHDYYGSYSVAFLAAGLFSFTSATCNYIVFFVHFRNKKK